MIYQPDLEWIVGAGEYYRNNRGSSLGGERRNRAAGRNDNRDARCDQFGGKPRQPIKLAARPAILDRNILSLDIAGVRKTTLKCRQDISGRLGRKAMQEANRTQARLLCVRRNRPSRCRAAN